MEKNIFLKQRGKKMVFTCEIKHFRHLTEKKKEPRIKEIPIMSVDYTIIETCFPLSPHSI